MSLDGLHLKSIWAIMQRATCLGMSWNISLFLDLLLIWWCELVFASWMCSMPAWWIHWYTWKVVFAARIDNNCWPIKLWQPWYHTSSIENFSVQLISIIEDVFRGSDRGDSCCGTSNNSQQGQNCLHGLSLCHSPGIKITCTTSIKFVLACFCFKIPDS